jgi:hypothetical protein
MEGILAEDSFLYGLFYTFMEGSGLLLLRQWLQGYGVVGLVIWWIVTIAFFSFGVYLVFDRLRKRARRRKKDREDE